MLRFKTVNGKRIIVGTSERDPDTEAYLERKRNRRATVDSRTRRGIPAVDGTTVQASERWTPSKVARAKTIKITKDGVTKHYRLKQGTQRSKGSSARSEQAARIIAEQHATKQRLLAKAGIVGNQVD